MKRLTPEMRAEECAETLRDVLGGHHRTVALVADLIRRAEIAAVAEATRPQPPAKLAAEVRDTILRVLSFADVPGTEFSDAVERLCWLLGLSPRERDFVRAAAADASDFDGMSVFCDWLKDQGRDADGNRVGLLTPNDGDVIVAAHEARLPDQAGQVMPGLDRLCGWAHGRGLDVFVLAVPAGVRVESISEVMMSGKGWVRSSRLSAALYDSAPGTHILDACRHALDGGYGGLVFNGEVVRVHEGDTPEAMAERYRAVYDGGGLNTA